MSGFFNICLVHLPYVSLKTHAKFTPNVIAY